MLFGRILFECASFLIGASLTTSTIEVIYIYIET